MFEQKDPHLKSIDPSSSIVFEGSMGQDVFEEFPAEIDEPPAPTLGTPKKVTLFEPSSSMAAKPKKTSTDKSHKDIVSDRPSPLRSTDAWLEDSENHAANDLIKTEIPSAHDITIVEEENPEQKRHKYQRNRRGRGREKYHKIIASSK